MMGGGTNGGRKDKKQGMKGRGREGEIKGGWEGGRERVREGGSE